MRKRLMSSVGVLAMLLLVGGCTAQEKKVEKLELNSLTDRVSYAYGLNLGQNFKVQEVEINSAIFVRGIEDGLAGTEPLMTEEEMVETRNAFQEDVTAKQKARAEKLAVDNKAAGEAFLAENKAKEGVVTTESGLQYLIIEEGTGKTPKVSDSVTVNYQGTLVDGTEFDSSYKRGEPVSFPVGGVIPGWTEALQLMKEGAKWQIVIPPSLAYGERGAGQAIGPNATLIFEVELLEVK